MKKTLLFILTAMVVCCFSSCKEKNAPDNGNNNQSDEMYVDLGLPSGTLWKSSNEVNGNHSSGLFTFDEAVNKFGQQLPTKEQCQELIDLCTWSLTFEGNKVIGPNKKYIILPADGYIEKGEDTVEENGEAGIYWTSAPSGTDGAWCMGFEPNNKEIYIEGDQPRSDRYSVRLVK